jgi:hypothetical protein
VSESPGDLAVAFRSFGRRFREAVQPLDHDADRARRVDSAVQELHVQLDGVMGSAAAIVKAAALTDDLTASGSAVAEAILRVPSDAWQPGQLDELRALALEGGRLLRKLEETVGGRS